MSRARARSLFQAKTSRRSRPTGGSRSSPSPPTAAGGSPRLPTLQRAKRVMRGSSCASYARDCEHSRANRARQELTYFAAEPSAGEARRDEGRSEFRHSTASAAHGRASHFVAFQPAANDGRASRHVTGAIVGLQPPSSGSDRQLRGPPGVAGSSRGRLGALLLDAWSGGAGVTPAICLAPPSASETELGTSRRGARAQARA
jgi:hypothetical protein